MTRGTFRLLERCFHPNPGARPGLEKFREGLQAIEAFTRTGEPPATERALLPKLNVNADGEQTSRPGAAAAGPAFEDVAIWLAQCAGPSSDAKFRFVSIPPPSDDSRSDSSTPDSDSDSQSTICLCSAHSSTTPLASSSSSSAIDSSLSVTVCAQQVPSPATTTTCLPAPVARNAYARPPSAAYVSTVPGGYM